MPEPHPFDVESSLLQLGAVNSLVGTLTSRTLMFPELQALLSAKASEPRASYQHLVVDENVCSKQSFSTRQKTFRHLRELYVLDAGFPLFAVWKILWDAAEEERRLLALLLAATREPLFRVTAATIFEAALGVIVTPQDFEATVEHDIPGHYRPVTRASLGRNSASAWTQSGHLSGRVNKVRAKATAGPASTTFALFLGHVTGERGLAALETFWVQLLDTSSTEVDRFAFAAATRGWLEYRRIGDVVDISFGRWSALLNETLIAETPRTGTLEF